MIKLLVSLINVLSHARRKQLIITLILMLVAAVAEFATIGAVLPFLAMLTGSPRASRLPGYHFLVTLSGGGRHEMLVAATMLLVIVSLASAVARLLVQHEVSRFVFAVGHDIGMEIFRRALHQPYAYYVGRNPSEVLAGVDKVQVLTFSVLTPLLQGAVSIVLAITIVATLTIIAPVATLVSASLVGAAYFFISMVTGRRLRENSHVIATAATARMRLMQEGLGALRDILIGHAQSSFEERFGAIDAPLRRAQGENMFVNAAPRFALEAAGVVMICGFSLYVGGKEGGFTAAIPVLGALVLGAQRLLPLANSTYLGWSLLGANNETISDILDLMTRPVVPERDFDGALLQFEREIRLDHIEMEYPGRPPALRGVSLVIEKGSMIGLCGSTGSGKSSLLDILMGLIEPTRGEVRVDGHVLDDEGRARWREGIGHVPQSVYLADASIASNIAFAQLPATIDMQRVREVAARAQLASFVESLPLGFDTIVGSGGVRISGGQRQRIAIARALYRDVRVLVMDEGTGQLDQDTEGALLTTIASLGGALTLVLASHSWSALAHCDRVYRLEAGRIIGEETGAEQHP